LKWPQPSSYIDTLSGVGPMKLYVASAVFCISQKRVIGLPGIISSANKVEVL